jgi:ABC-2 type transport system permease protein
MLTDIATIVWKESKEFIQGSSRGSSVARLLFPIALAGILLPWRSGRGYVTGTTALIGLFWILPMVAVSLTVDSVAGERERHTLESLLATRLSDQAVLFGKLAASVMYAWGMMLTSLVVGLITVNLRQRLGAPLLFSPAYAATLVIVSFLGAILVCGLAVLVSVRASTVRQAAQTFAYGSTGIIVGSVFGAQALPLSWRLMIVRILIGPYSIQAELVAGLIFVALDLAVLAAARHRFQRARLILD